MTRIIRTDRELVPRAREDAHADHHLWKNGRTWWVAFTFHTHDGQKYRVRRSLGTDRVDQARVRRDELLERHARQPGWRLALRFVARERRASNGDASALEARASARVA